MVEVQDGSDVAAVGGEQDADRPDGGAQVVGDTVPAGVVLDDDVTMSSGMSYDGYGASRVRPRRPEPGVPICTQPSPAMFIHTCTGSGRRVAPCSYQATASPWNSRPTSAPTST